MQETSYGGQQQPQRQFQPSQRWQEQGSHSTPYQGSGNGQQGRMTQVVDKFDDSVITLTTQIEKIEQAATKLLGEQVGPSQRLRPVLAKGNGFVHDIDTRVEILRDLSQRFEQVTDKLQQLA